MSVTKRLAIVTGANRGLGFETCRQLAKRNLRVVLTSRSESKGQAAVDKLRAEGLEVFYHQLDVIDIGSIERLDKFIREKFDRLDVLVNNAGVLLDPGEVGDVAASVFEAEIDTLHQSMQTHVYGPLLLCQTFVPLMKKYNYGRIVNVSSIAAKLSSKWNLGGRPAYRISKAALNMLTRILADELKDTNILVNSVCPGTVKTDMGGSNASLTPEQGADKLVWLATLPDNGPTSGFFWAQKPSDRKFTDFLDKALFLRKARIF